MTDQNVFQSKVDVANTILAVGQGYPFWDAVWAFPENAIDSCHAVENDFHYDGYVPHVWIEARRDRFVIWDNGTGMNPFMHPRALTRIEQYIQGMLPDVENIWDDQYIDDSSKRSLQWMVQCIALSAKLANANRYQRGEKGTGANAYLRLGDKVEIYTRPIRALRESAYIPREFKDTGTYLLTRPTKTQLSRKNVNSTIVPYNDAFTDPFGNELEHGTVVVISGFDAGVPELLTFKGLHNCVQKEAGSDAPIVSVCSYVDKSRELQGKWRTVTTTEKHGKKVLIDRLVNDEDLAGFNVALFIDLTGKRTGVWVTKKGSKKFLITDLEEFNVFPWTEMEGSVEFPEYQGGNIWDPSKKYLLNSDQRVYWTNTLKRIEGIASAEVNASKNALTERIFEGLAGEISKIGQEIIGNFAAFSNTRFPGASIKRSSESDKKEKQKVQSRIENRILVFVINEHKTGYSKPAEAHLEGPGIDITKPTGLKGKINFGAKMPAGEYKVTLRYLPNTRLRSNNPQRFTLSNDSPGKIIIFEVETGTPPPEVRHRSPTFKVFFNLGDDPDIPWKQFLDTEGIIEINIGSDALHQAIVDNNEFAKKALIAQYIVQALKEYCDKELISLTLLDMSVLYGEFLSRLTR